MGCFNSKILQSDSEIVQGIVVDDVKNVPDEVSHENISVKFKSMVRIVKSGEYISNFTGYTVMLDHNMIMKVLSLPGVKSCLAVLHAFDYAPPILASAYHIKIELFDEFKKIAGIIQLTSSGCDIITMDHLPIDKANPQILREIIFKEISSVLDEINKK
jgi:hypothetical protein